MPFDPYFSRNGADKFTCRGEPRAVYTEAEKAAADLLLNLPEKERVALNAEIRDRLRADDPDVTRAELLFHHTMRRRSRARAHLPPCAKKPTQKA